ncbi:chloramphenicol acetyltransferase [Tamlana fucoidanivorans]|uniref:Chloramphenicol acetyltransferase n=1 Tax=Allotamlana fucoidanivorans TaxID=2583814 RepID=A0A5C4SDX2_9FLAO|nr:CatA-like O-acetyltransferase [Tamlana fucoidanivorans]TNJ41709.1 chloramphenicol acetyltransferase [Tamlana fucoidanivorans]
MKLIDLNTWNRKALYHHFSTFKDPYFGITAQVNVSRAYLFSKKNKISFFARYLHDCMKAINTIDNLKLRIQDGQVVMFDVINASATISRKDNTFGFSFIDYDESFSKFKKNFESEKKRIHQSDELFPSNNGLDCIHCSALPWINFTGHKEPVSGKQESIPKLSFGKVVKNDHDMMMRVGIQVNHALVDGYHVGLFFEKFQENLDK